VKTKTKDDLKVEEAILESGERAKGRGERRRKQRGEESRRKGMINA
jgi:hypothetical protein